MALGGQRAASGRREWQIFAFGADSAGALAALTHSVAGWLEGVAGDPADVAARLRLDVGDGSWRRAVLARTAKDAAVALREESSERVLSDHVRATVPEVGFLFPGSGAQRVNMGRGLYRTERVFREEFDRCGRAFMEATGGDLKALVFADGTDVDGVAERLDTCSHFMPVIFAFSYALAQQWIAWGIRPAAMIGHSLGEFTAATLAGVFEPGVAIGLVRRRGELIQAQPAGGMLTVRLPVEEARRRLSGRMEVSLINSPDLCVISGLVEEIEGLERQLTGEGVMVRRLKVSHAMHSGMVAGAMAPVAELVARIRPAPPVIPYVSNLTGRWITPEEATDPSYYARHVRNTVQFEAGLTTLLERTGIALLEVGPGQGLTSLARQHPARIEGQIVTSSVYTLREDEEASLLHAIARFWVAGFPLGEEAFGDGRAGAVESVPGNLVDHARGRHLPMTDAVAPGISEPRPPAGDTEIKVAAEWCGLLKRVEIADRHGNFFELGGNSLLALQWVRRIREVWEVEVTLASLFSDPTVAGAAGAIDAEVIRVRAGCGVVPGACLTPIQTGGRRRPLFVFPGGNGEDAELYVHAMLSERHYGPDQPVYAFRRHGWDGRAVAILKVPAMVREYLLEMRRVQPVGPYCLLGDCAGGPVAHEMACQLLGAGEAVDLLLLTDARCPRPGEMLRDHVAQAWLGTRRTSVVGFVVALGRLFTLRGEERRRFVREKWERARGRLHRLPEAGTGKASAPGPVASAPGRSDAAGRFQARYAAVDDYFTPGGRIYWETTRRHVPRFYPGTVHLISSEERSALPSLARWRRFAREVRFEVVGSSHWLYLWNHADRVAEIVKSATLPGPRA